MILIFTRTEHKTSSEQQTERLRAAERKFGDLNGSHSPSFATIRGAHLAGDALALAHGVNVVGIGNIKDYFGVSPSCLRYVSSLLLFFSCLSPMSKLTVSGHGTAVLLSTLNSATPALSVAVAGRQLSNLLAVDGDDLGVVARVVVELVVHGDLVAGDRIMALGLHRHLRVGSSRQKSVAIDAPLIAVPVVRDRLNEVAIGSAHANPKRGIALVVAGSLG